MDGLDRSRYSLHQSNAVEFSEHLGKHALAVRTLRGQRLHGSQHPRRVRRQQGIEQYTQLLAFHIAEHLADSGGGNLAPAMRDRLVCQTEGIAHTALGCDGDLPEPGALALESLCRQNALEMVRYLLG